MVTIRAIIPIVLLIRSGFELVGLILPSPGLITPLKMFFCLLFNVFGLSMSPLVAIGFAVHAIEVKEVEEAAVTIGWLCHLGLGLGAERGNVEQVVRVF